MGYCRPENSVFLCPQNSGSALNDLFYDSAYWKGWRSTQKFNNGFYENFLFDLMKLFILTDVFINSSEHIHIADTESVIGLTI